MVEFRHLLQSSKLQPTRVRAHTERVFSNVPMATEQEQLLPEGAIPPTREGV
jgi:hypothetical protein